MSSMVPLPGACVGDPWAEALAQAQREWGPFGLPLERFAARADAHVARRLARAGADATSAAREATVRRTARADLAIAVACDERTTGAWEALHRRLLPRLRGLARKRGLSDVDAETLASDVLSELALPPGGTSGARTLLGTFDGTGSLFGWSAVILVRRLSRLRRPPPDPPVRDADRLDPAQVLGDTESAQRFEGALRAGWERLAPRERVALAYRYVDGKTQVEIARRLRLSAPRLSRVLTGAVAKLRSGLERAGVGARATGPLWDVLADALRKRMAPTSASAPLPDQPGARPPAREP